MTRSEFLKQFSPDNPDHRKLAAKILCDPPVANKRFYLPPLRAGGPTGLLIDGAYVEERQGYRRPRAVFGANGWEWRFTLEFFVD